MPETNFEKCPNYLKLGRVTSDLDNLDKKVKNMDEHDVQPLKGTMMSRVSMRLFLVTVILIAAAIGSIWLMSWSIKGSIHEIDKKVSLLSGTHDSMKECITKLTENVTELTINQRIRLDRECRETQRGELGG